MKTRKFYTKLIVLALMMLFSINSFAGIMIDESFSYMSSSGNNNIKDTKMFNSIVLGAPVGNRFYIAWNLLTTSRADEVAGATSKETSLEMGPKVGLYVDKGQKFCISLALNPYVKGSQSIQGASAAALTGFSYMLDLGYILNISKSFWIGPKIIYHGVSYSKSEVSNVTSTISYSRSTILPMISIQARF